ncbi:MAG: tRNA (N(6)-L-threonylcarbamoyladenosine(37)-C(2))-methylthiotransferase MtaB [Nitrospirae bacterium]|nr:tRNA (N(6)-L-threonylcarbamoyladenosine(37)-C(2))-methylthiotransferase MtaB [Nitrospirota bacterium]
MKIAIATLGCKVNQSESASIEGILRGQGHEIVLMANDHFDACIINTCTVTAKSDYQSRQLIRRVVRSGVKVIVTGCYAQLHHDELSKINGINLILGNSQKDNLHEYLGKLSQDYYTPSHVIGTPDTPLTLKPYFSNRARAFLKIQDGCNFSCTYCAVPMARGKNRSLRPVDVLSAVEKLCADGYKEIVLTGVHIGCYGIELTPKSSLVEIVDNIVKKYSSMRLRLSSIEPQEFKNEFLSLIKSKSVCPHLHIPLQSGSDKILEVMNRGYSISFFKELINMIDAACPDISIGTDVIAGFPGENNKDFEDTKNLLQELPLSYIHVFPYSKRKNTLAAKMPGQICNETKRKRLEIFLEISKIKKINYITRHLNKILDVIVEPKSQINGYYKGTSDNYLKVLIEANSLNPGQRIRVRTISFNNEGLISKPL